MIVPKQYYIATIANYVYHEFVEELHKHRIIELKWLNVYTHGGDDEREIR